MASPVIVEFILKGIPDIARGMKSVEQAATASERAQTAASQRGAQQRVTMAEREARDKVRAMSKMDAEVRRIQDRANREVAKQAAQRAREEARADREMLRSAERAAQEKLRIQRQVDREFSAMQKRQQAERDRIIREDERREERAAQNRARIRERSATMAGRYSAAQGAAEARSRETFYRGIGAGVSRGFTNGVSAVAGGVSKVGGMFAQLGSGFSIADAVMSEKNLRKQAAVLSANTIMSGAGKPGADPSIGGAMSTDQVLARAKAIGIEQNMDPSEVMKGFDAVKKLTGNLEKATQITGGLAKMATATGTDMADMSGLAANVLAVNPNISNEELMKQMRIFTRQGIVGGVEVGDFAKYGSRITGAAANFGVDKSKGVTKETNEATLSAMAQMARQYGTASTPAEAAMGSLRFATDLGKSANKLKSQGIDVTDGKGNLRDAQGIILDMLKKTNGDVTKLGSMGLGERGVKPLEGAANIYKSAGGGEAGLEAVRKEFQKYTTGVTEDEIDAANKRVLAESQAEIEILKLRTAVGEQLLPELMKLVPVLRDALPTVQRLLTAFVNMANWAANNPFSAVGATLAVSIGKSVAEAGVGEAIKKALESSLGAKGGLVLSSAALAITTATIAVETIAQRQAAQVSSDVGQSNAAFSTAAGVRTGDRNTSEQIAAMVAERDRLQKRVTEEKANVNSKEGIEYLGMAGKAASYVPLIYAARKATGIGADESEWDQSAAYQKSRDDRLKQSEEALARMNEAIMRATDNLNKLGSTPAPPGGAAATTGIVQRVQ